MIFDKKYYPLLVIGAIFAVADYFLLFVREESDVILFWLYPIFLCFVLFFAFSAVRKQKGIEDLAAQEENKRIALIATVSYVPWLLVSVVYGAICTGKFCGITTLFHTPATVAVAWFTDGSLLDVFDNVVVDNLPKIVSNSIFGIFDIIVFYYLIRFSLFLMRKISNRHRSVNKDIVV